MSTHAPLPYWLKGTGADCGCGGCDPTAGDRPCPTCACCDEPADLAVPLDGWASLDGSRHSIAYCARCWRDLQRARDHDAALLPVVPITRTGARLLRETAASARPHQLSLFGDGAA